MEQIIINLNWIELLGSNDYRESFFDVAGESEYGFLFLLSKGTIKIILFKLAEIYDHRKFGFQWIEFWKVIQK